MPLSYDLSDMLPGVKHKTKLKAPSLLPVEINATRMEAAVATAEQKIEATASYSQLSSTEPRIWLMEFRKVIDAEKVDNLSILLSIFHEKLLETHIDLLVIYAVQNGKAKSLRLLLTHPKATVDIYHPAGVSQGDLNGFPYQRNTKQYYLTLGLDAESRLWQINPDFLEGMHLFGFEVKTYELTGTYYSLFNHAVINEKYDVAFVLEKAAKTFPLGYCNGAPIEAPDTFALDYTMRQASGMRWLFKNSDYLLKLIDYHLVLNETVQKKWAEWLQPDSSSPKPLRQYLWDFAWENDESTLLDKLLAPNWVRNLSKTDKPSFSFEQASGPKLWHGIRLLIIQKFGSEYDPKRQLDELYDLANEQCVQSCQDKSRASRFLSALYQYTVIETTYDKQLNWIKTVRYKLTEGDLTGIDMLNKKCHQMNFMTDLSKFCSKLQELAKQLSAILPRSEVKATPKLGH